MIAPGLFELIHGSPFHLVSLAASRRAVLLVNGIPPAHPPHHDPISSQPIHRMKDAVENLITPNRKSWDGSHLMSELFNDSDTQPDPRAPNIPDKGLLHLVNLQTNPPTPATTKRKLFPESTAIPAELLHALDSSIRV
jgi:hypothetical protein